MHEIENVIDFVFKLSVIIPFVSIMNRCDTINVIPA